MPEGMSSRKYKKENGKITWDNNCELCFACFNWCPKKAIHIKDEINSSERSHNSNIKSVDIIKGNE